MSKEHRFSSFCISCILICAIFVEEDAIFTQSTVKQHANNTHFSEMPFLRKISIEIFFKDCMDKFNNKAAIALGYVLAMQH